MDKPIYFKPWITGWQRGIKLLLFLLLMTGITQFSLYGLVQSYILGYLGVQPEDISFSTQITYAGIIASFPLQARFLRFFQLRSYLLAMLIGSMILSILSFNIVDLYLFMILRVLTGFFVAGVGICCLTLILSRLAPFEAQAIGYSVFYGSLLGSGVLSGSLVYLVTDDTDWKKVYLVLMFVQAMALFLVVLALKPRDGHKPYPLYQLEWPSAILALIAYIGLAYIFVYGPKYYWLDDPRIGTCVLITLVSLAVLFYRQTTLKRPYLHPHVFRNRNFLLGLLLLAFYYGIKDSINLIYAYTLNVLRWDTQELIRLSACNVAGLVTGMIASASLQLSGKFRTRHFLMAGFSLLLAYHIWMYHIFSTDLSFANLAGPVILQGMSSGMLFVPIIVFTISTLPPYTGYTGVTIGAVTRFVSTLNGISGFYTLQLYYNQQNKETFLRHITTLDQPFIERLGLYAQVFVAGGYTPEQSNLLAAGSVTRALTVQSQLLTNMEIFKLIAFMLAGLLIITIIVSIVKWVRHS